jgi:hypothetical protein
LTCPPWPSGRRSSVRPHRTDLASKKSSCWRVWRRPEGARALRAAAAGSAAAAARRLASPRPAERPRRTTGYKGRRPDTMLVAPARAVGQGNGSPRDAARAVSAGLLKLTIASAPCCHTPEGGARQMADVGTMRRTPERGG